MKKIFITNFFMLIYSLNLLASGRISHLEIDKSKIEKIYIVPGLASLLQLPCSIDQAIIGNPQEVSGKITEISDRELIIHLNKGLSRATNLLVKCKKSKKYMAFDLVPNKHTHQDIVTVSHVFNHNSILINSSQTKKTISPYKKLLKKGSF